MGVGKQLRRSLHPRRVEDTDRRQTMAQVSARMAAALARQGSKATQLSKQIPTISVAARQLSSSSKVDAAKAGAGEISSILEERVLAAAPLSTSRRLAVSSPLETVSPVSMASRTSRPRRWWSSAPASRAWLSTWSLTTLVLSFSVMTSSSRRVTLSREPEPLWMFPLARRSLDVLLMLWVTPLTARAPLDARRGTELD